MSGNESRLVSAFRLETQFLPDGVRHVERKPEPSFQGPPILSTETWQAHSTIGQGSFGSVRLERRSQTALDTAETSSSYQFRAVKTIRKTVPNLGRIWDPIRELEAIAKFSQRQYAPYFVRMYGWFEDAEQIYIAMEFCPLGDLRLLMDRQPAFSEESASAVILQLVKGIRFMHDGGFAHRDLKPSNILVGSTNPTLVVKIADFGISKQARDTGANTLDIGTIGYMAPEVFGLFTSDHGNAAYSVLVDMWAIGVITVELLLKQHPFPSISDLIAYIQTKELVLDTHPEVHLSRLGRDFVMRLLSSHSTRPTAMDTIGHLWLAEAIPDSDEDSMVLESDVDDPGSPIRDILSPASLPSLAWSNLQLTAERSSSHAEISELVAGECTSSFLFQLSRPLTNAVNCQTKYFVLRSDNALDIETSAAHGVWTSSQRVNKILDKGFTRTNGHVVLFFSVIKSQKFCGVAQMTSALDWIHTDDHWMEDNWKGRFTLEWLSFTELQFQKVKHVPVSRRTPGFRAIACYDGTEISADSAFQLLTAFSTEEQEHNGTLHNRGSDAPLL